MNQSNLLQWRWANFVLGLFSAFCELMAFFWINQSIDNEFVHLVWGIELLISRQKKTVGEGFLSMHILADTPQ